MNRWNLNNAGVVLACLVSSAAMAQTPILSAPQIAAQLDTGAMVLIDIRSREEWEQTGLAKGAWPVSMHDRDFAAHLSALLQRHPADQIAMICATGGRTAYVAEILAKNGVTGIADVSEGMMGNARGPGWIARGMPVVSLQEAQNAYQTALAGE